MGIRLQDLWYLYRIWTYLSIWSGVPPPSVSLLNITDLIVSTEIGDITTTTSLEGVKVSMLNEEEPGPLLFTCFIRICWPSNYAVYTDSMNNRLPTVEPFHLFQGFIDLLRTGAPSEGHWSWVCCILYPDALIYPTTPFLKQMLV